MRTSYTSLAKLFHWTTAAAVIGLLLLGHYMTTLELSPTMLQLYSWHKWIGLTVLAITVLRLVWRITHRPPPLPSTMPAGQRFLAHAGHWALYGLLFAMPVVGWLYSSASGFPVVLFGVMPLPDPVLASKPLADILGYLHWIGGWVLVALIAGHVAAALWHHIGLGDDILVRMMPGKLKGKTVVSLAAVALAATLALPAVAGPDTAWKLEDSSKFTFAARQLNVPITGEFKAFEAKIVFDPAAPEQASIDLTVDATSITTGNGQADQLLPGPDWFSVAEHPQATFSATEVSTSGGDAYEIKGLLTLKGKSEPVTLQSTITVADDPDDPALLRASAKGEATISRTTFKIGQGQWADTKTIADDVVVAFEFTARRPK